MTATEANKIQAQWLALESEAPREEVKRVCALFDQLPKSFIARTDSGRAQLSIGGQPAHARPEPLEECKARARKAGIQTALQWHTRGEWIADPA